ncbi:MAG: hypothetical protein ACLQNE_33265, partial [Thermoguttaceae bacterium]
DIAILSQTSYFTNAGFHMCRTTRATPWGVDAAQSVSPERAKQSFGTPPPHSFVTPFQGSCATFTPVTQGDALG